MGFFKKKADPINDRSRELKSRIADLESKIKRLEANGDSPPHGRVPFHRLSLPAPL